MMGHCSLTVVDLKRVSIGGVQLGNLEQGEMRQLTYDEIDSLYRKFGGWDIIEADAKASIESRLERPETLTEAEREKIRQYLAHCEQVA